VKKLSCCSPIYFMLYFSPCAHINPSTTSLAVLLTSFVPFIIITIITHRFTSKPSILLLQLINSFCNCYCCVQIKKWLMRGVIASFTFFFLFHQGQDKWSGLDYVMLVTLVYHDMLCVSQQCEICRTCSLDVDLRDIIQFMQSRQRVNGHLKLKFTSINLDLHG
jgi:hypothetical protein